MRFRRYDGPAFEINGPLLEAVGPSEREALLATEHHPLGLLAVPPGPSRSRLIGLVCRFWHRARVLIPCARIMEARRLAGELGEYLGGNIDAVHKGTWRSGCRVVCCTFHSAHAADPADWDIVIFARGEQAISVKAGVVRAEFHEGTCEDFLRRHEIEAVSAAQGTNRQRQRFAGCLLQRAADSRNSRVAIEHLATKGGPAPGPNGLRLRDLDDQERWDLARALSRAIRSGQYRPGPSRKVMIPKGPGRGHRPLRLQNVEDRAVQRAIVQVVQPLVDPHFRLSFGYRPGLGREHALAAAEQLAAAGHRWVWITEDVKDAFENVPHGRLLEVVRRQVPANDLVELIWVIIANRRSKGIRQGSPLSPLLLNLYLHWLLDRRWHHGHPDVPLLRAADDLLVLCQSREQAQEAYENLEQAVRQAGMALKGNPEGTIRDLAAGQEAHWLGYRLRKEGSDLRVSLTERSWYRLEEGLMLAHEEPDAPLAANRVILGWTNQQGAACGTG